MSRSASPRFIVQHHDPAAVRRRVAVVALFWALSLVLAAAAAWLLAQSPASGPDPVEFARLRQENQDLKQRVAVLERADQVDRVASSDLQQTLREREEEIAGLRTDLGFYSRLVGGGARREGLAVHSVHVTPVRDSGAWNVVVTLTQNMKRSQSSEGRLQFAVEGVANGQLRNLAWSDLAAPGDSAGLPFSFKYFQRVSGTVMLPAGFSPNRIKVVAEATGGGGRVEQGFAWSEAQAAEESSNVQQQEK